MNRKTGENYYGDDGSEEKNEDDEEGEEEDEDEDKENDEDETTQYWLIKKGTGLYPNKVIFYKNTTV